MSTEDNRRRQREAERLAHQFGFEVPLGATVRDCTVRLHRSHWRDAENEVAVTFVKEDGEPYTEKQVLQLMEPAAWPPSKDLGDYVEPRDWAAALMVVGVLLIVTGALGMTAAVSWLTYLAWWEWNVIEDRNGSIFLSRLFTIVYWLGLFFGGGGFLLQAAEAIKEGEG